MLLTVGRNVNQHFQWLNSFLSWHHDCHVQFLSLVSGTTWSNYCCSYLCSKLITNWRSVFWIIFFFSVNLLRVWLRRLWVLQTWVKLRQRLMTGWVKMIWWQLLIFLNPWKTVKLFISDHKKTGKFILIFFLQDPYNFLVGFITALSIHLFSCALLIFGAFWVNKWNLTNQEWWI